MEEDRFHSLGVFYIQWEYVFFITFVPLIITNLSAMIQIH